MYKFHCYHKISKLCHLTRSCDKIYSSNNKNKLVHYVKFVSPICIIKLTYFWCHLIAIFASEEPWMSFKIITWIWVGSFQDNWNWYIFCFSIFIDNHSWRELLSHSIFHLKLNHIKNFHMLKISLKIFNATSILVRSSSTTDIFSQLTLHQCRPMFMCKSHLL